MKTGGPKQTLPHLLLKKLGGTEPQKSQGLSKGEPAKQAPEGKKDTFTKDGKVDDSFGKGWDKAWAKNITFKPSTSEAKVVEGDKTTTTSTENTGLDKFNTTSVATKDGDTSFTKSQTHRNGRLLKTSNGSSTTSGDVTTSNKTDRTFHRDGSVRTEEFTHGIKTKYGENASIERTITQNGSHSSETIKSEFKSGNQTRTDTVSTASGAKTNWDGWDKSKISLKDGKLSSVREVKYTDKKESSKKTEITRDYNTTERTPEETTARNEKIAGRQKNIDRAQLGLDLAAELGLRTKVAGGKVDSGVKKGGVLVDTKNVSADGKTETTAFVGGRANARAAGSVLVGADGLRARGKAEAKAGYYAETSGKHTGEMGTVSGHVKAKLGEAVAVAEGDARLNLNGLNATGKVKVGVEVSAEVAGKYETPSVNVAGVDVNASVDVRGKAGLYANAEAKGTVAITGNPPKAIIEGEAGASAVAKAEGHVRASAGPFSVKADGYVSAGAEARVSGSIGYDDGKLKLSFGGGAALGVGAGGKVSVEVDVKQIGEMAVNTAKAAGEAIHDAADIDGDGKLSFNDIRAGAEAVSETVENAAEAVGDAIVDSAEAVGDAIVDGAEAVGDAIVDGAEAVGDAITDVAKGAKSALSKGAKWISSWF